MDVEGPTAPSCLCVRREMPCDAWYYAHSRLPIGHVTERGKGRLRAMELEEEEEVECEEAAEFHSKQKEMYNLEANTPLRVLQLAQNPVHWSQQAGT